MVDITKCNGNNCKQRDLCYRYTAPACKHMQSYFAEEPEKDKDGSCEAFWDNSVKPIKTEKNIEDKL